MDILLQWLLLSFAVAIGWALGYFAQHRSKKHSRVSNKAELETKLKLLFDSYNNKSIETFVQSLEVSAETLPMHLSIGAHFRAKGEVDKAILIHQNLMSRPELGDYHSHEVTYELAKDYIAAGLLDRGEGLLLQLQSSKAYGQKSRRLLVDIFQKEKEWAQALSKALELDGRRQGVTATMISHFYCEVASIHQGAGHILDTQRMLKEAVAYDKQNVRAYLALSELCFAQNDYTQAILILRKAVEQDLDFAPVVIDKLADYSEITGSQERFLEYLAGLIGRYSDPALICTYALHLSRYKGVEVAQDYLWQKLESNPGLVLLSAWFALKSQSAIDVERPLYRLMHETSMISLEDKPAYQCRQCGFAGSQLHWQCPGCKTWGKVKPVKGIHKD